MNGQHHPILLLISKNGDFVETRHAQKSDFQQENDDPKRALPSVDSYSSAGASKVVALNLDWGTRCEVGSQETNSTTLTKLCRTSNYV